MADTVTTTTLLNTQRKLVVQYTIQSDGTGTTDGIVVDKSAFTGPDGTEPGRLVVEKIDYAVDGMQLVLEFDHTADDVIAVLAGQGSFDFVQDGMYQGFIDPASAGTTGDIVVTTVGHTLGDKGTFTIYCCKKD